jgi:nucleoside-diphosphate-sugar epimerase
MSTGTLRRYLSIAKLAALGFKPKINSRTGFRDIVGWYSRNRDVIPTNI